MATRPTVKFALFSNTTGLDNTAVGNGALYYNTTGTENTSRRLPDLRSFSNTTGSNNIASGLNALFNNITGGSNIALGAYAGYNLVQGDNNIYIGNRGPNGAESGTIRIGTAGTQTQTFIADISGTAVSGAAVVVNTEGSTRRGSVLGTFQG